MHFPYENISNFPWEKYYAFIRHGSFDLCDYIHNWFKHVFMAIFLRNFAIILLLYNYLSNTNMKFDITLL